MKLGDYIAISKLPQKAQDAIEDFKRLYDADGYRDGHLWRLLRSYCDALVDCEIITENDAGYIMEYVGVI